VSFKIEELYLQSGKEKLLAGLGGLTNHKKGVTKRLSREKGWLEDGLCIFSDNCQIICFDETIFGSERAKPDDDGE